MVLLLAVVWEEGQPVSWKYSLLHTILTSQLGEVRSLQHIASTCDAFQLYHLELPLETFGNHSLAQHWPSWPAPTLGSGIAKWLPVNPTATSLAKNSKDKLIPGIQSGRGLSGANVPTLTWKTCHHLDPEKFTVSQWPLCFLLGYIFQPGKW